MEERDRSRSPSRRTSRVEQVVGRWLRRSRESSSRERILGAGESSVQEQRSHPVRLTVQILRDPLLHSHGLTLSSQTPLLVQDVTPDGPADGRLVPGDQVVKINNVAVDDLTPEQAADLIRECPDCVLITILRNSVGPKSSFITPEKRAKLRSNPIKVHFAEEVEVNGHSQGNSLLFLPNVLKVYLENGQTKAFKFEPTTTVKDIVMTLKEKLSLCRIEHFSLVLEQQYSITKLVLLHEEEQIQQVVQKKEAHDYRCLFRVCFMPIEPQHLLQDDPTAFEYLYLQSINDVLQERFAVEMRCNTALRLAALHIQERLASCGQSPRNSLKIIMRTWGIENFVSSTLLRNMSEKDLRKAIGYHMKKCQSQDPKQKVLSANQARINYLQELSDLKSFGGKSFSATMMLQDRESMVTLLVGSRYGISQVVNHKLSIMTTLTEFSSITRIELLPESERVSLVKMYLQDIKPITLLLESVAAKDLSCLVAGYCRALVDPRLVIFPWVQDAKHHRVSTEEGYVSHCGSDSDDSTDIDTLMSLVSHSKKRTASDPVGLRRIMEERKEERKEKKKRENEKKEPVEGEKNIKYSTLSPSRKSCEKDRPEMLRDDNRNNKDLKGEGGGDQRNKDPEGSEKEGKASENQGMQEDEREENEKANEDKRQQEEERGREEERGGEEREGTMEEQPSVSEEASDSCRTDSRFMTSISSDSLDLLEEDDLIACSSSLPHFQIHPSSHLTIEPPHPRPYPRGGESSPQGTEHCGGGGRGVASCTNSGSVNSVQLSAIIDPSEHMNYAELSLMLEYLPSPPEASDEEDEDEEKRKREGVSSDSGRPRSSSSSHTDCVFTFEQSDARCYYNICTSVTPDSARSLTHPCTDPLTHSDAEKENGGEEDGQRAVLTLEAVPILQPPPGFSDSSSDEEFFDARDQFVSPEDPKSGAVPIDFSAEMSSGLPDRTVSPSDIRFSLAEGGCKEREGEVSDEGGEKGDREMVPRTSRKRLKKRRSFMETNFTSTVSYPGPDQNQGWDVDQYPDQFQSLTEGSDDTQWLSLDPEPSEQSEIPCPTVSSLIHAEGEASQLESKPIIPKPSQGGAQPWAPSNTDAEFQRSSRSRRQSMETEPDVMESKSVTALVTAASITVVRCRVGPDGKESTDRRGDGEEGAGAGTAPFTSHVFLSEEWEGETGDNGDEKLPMPFSEGPPSGRRSQFNKRPLFIRSEERGKAFFIPQICISPPGVYGRNTEYEESLTPALHTPPCTPIPSLPGPSTSHMVRGGTGEETNLESLPKPSTVSELEKHSSCLTQAHRKITVSRQDVAKENTEASSASPNFHVVVNTNVLTNDSGHAVMVNNKPTGCTDCITDTANHKDTTSVQSFAVNTIANANIDLASSNIDFSIANKDVNASNTLASTDFDLVTANIDFSIANKDDNARTTMAGTYTDLETANIDFSIANLDTKASVQSSVKDNCENASLCSYMASIDFTGNTNSVAANLPKDSPVSPTCGLIHQPCSQGIIGQSLSASTLRGKIQSLPLYLSCSQETPTRNASPKPTSKSTLLIASTETENAKDNVVAVAESKGFTQVESDDSEVTPTKPVKVTVEMSGVETARLTMSEVKEVVEKVVMVYGSTPSSEHVCLCANPDPKMSAKLPFIPIAEVETNPPLSSVPVCLEKTSNHETQGSIVHKMATPVTSCSSTPSVPMPIRIDPKSDHEPLSLSNKKFALSSSCPPALVLTTDNLNSTPIRVEPKPNPLHNPLSSGPQMSTSLTSFPSAAVVTTQSLNGPVCVLPSKVGRRTFGGNRDSLCKPPGEEPGLVNTVTTGFKVFPTFTGETQSEWTQTTQAQPGSYPPAKPDFGCSSMLVSGCETVLEGVQAPIEACGCPPPLLYTNCFSGEDSFDDELTVYEFSCRATSPPSSQSPPSSLAFPLMTSTPLTSFLSSSRPSLLSPSFPRSVLPSFSPPELSPLLSPSDCFLSQPSLQDDIGRLRHRHYPPPPAGFQTIRSDVDELLALLQEGRLGGKGGRHPRETCATHFTENKRLLHGEARRLMAGCQTVVRVGQTPDEMLLSLGDSFRTLVGMAGVCLWFSGCDRCDRRNADALAGLADLARTYRDFALAAERASGRRSCHDLSTKLLAKQCTALTASVFCLTQLFRTLTAL